MAHDPRPIMRVLIGAPGTGKTTWCRRHQSRLGAVLCLDQARAIVGAGEDDLTATPGAVALASHAASRLLAAGCTVTLDATGSKIGDRATWLAIAARQHARPFAVVLRTPLETAFARNAARRRQVPAEVIRAMWQRIHRTTSRALLGEGFLTVTELSTQDPKECAACGTDPEDTDGD